MKRRIIAKMLRIFEWLCSDSSKIAANAAIMQVQQRNSGKDDESTPSAAKHLWTTNLRKNKRLNSIKTTKNPIWSQKCGTTWFPEEIIHAYHGETTTWFALPRVDLAL